MADCNGRCYADHQGVEHDEWMREPGQPTRVGNERAGYADAFHERTGRCLTGAHDECRLIEGWHRTGDHRACLPNDECEVKRAEVERGHVTSAGNCRLRQGRAISAGASCYDCAHTVTEQDVERTMEALLAPSTDAQARERRRERDEQDAKVLRRILRAHHDGYVEGLTEDDRRTLAGVAWRLSAPGRCCSNSPEGPGLCERHREALKNLITADTDPIRLPVTVERCEHRYSGIRCWKAQGHEGACTPA